MVAAVNQDFVTYQGDDVSPIFTVYANSAQTAVVDISTVAEITWKAQRNADSGVIVAITKTKSAGQITFVTTGVDGKFQVAITKTDTVSLDGYYMHFASIADAFGNVTTTTVGRMQVGLHPAWTFDQSMIATTPLYQVRDLIGDTLIGDQQLVDAQIEFSIASFSNIYLAAADCCRKIAMRYAREVDITQGELHTVYSQRTRNYTAMVRMYTDLGMQRGGVMPFAGGISIADKTNRVEDPDRVPPQFNLLMFDDLIPLGTGSGNQTPIPGTPDFSNSI